MSARHPDLERLVAGDLQGARLARARSHISSCPACRRSYQSMVEAERFMAHGHVDAPSRPEYERMFDVTLAHLSATPAPRRWAIWAGIPAFAAAAALVLFSVLPSENNEFREKSGANVQANGVRAFCHRDSHTAFSADAALTCQRGSSLVVGVHSVLHEQVNAHFWLLDQAGQAHLPPRSDAGGQVVQRSDGEQVLDASIDVNAGIALGAGELVVVLCQDCTLDEAQRDETLPRHRITVRVVETQP